MALTDNLVSWWTMKEASGNRSDSHGINVLTDVNTVGSATGKVGTAASLVAANSERFTHVDNAELRLGGTDWTWSVWFYPTAEMPANQHLVWKSPGGANSNGYGIFVRSNVIGGLIGMGANGNLNISWTVTIPHDQWHHLFVWYDSAAGRTYGSLNGGTPQSTVQSFPQVDGTTTFELGARTGVQNFNGLIDEVALWKRALTETERAEIYNGGAGVTYLDIAATSGVGINWSLIRRIAAIGDLRFSPSGATY